MSPFHRVHMSRHGRVNIPIPLTICFSMRNINPGMSMKNRTKIRITTKEV